jgi:hypothetical protein
MIVAFSIADYSVKEARSSEAPSIRASDATQSSILRLTVHFQDRSYAIPNDLVVSERRERRCTSAGAKIRSDQVRGRAELLTSGCARMAASQSPFCTGAHLQQPRITGTVRSHFLHTKPRKIYCTFTKPAKDPGSGDDLKVYMTRPTCNMKVDFN